MDLFRMEHDYDEDLEKGYISIRKSKNSGNIVSEPVYSSMSFAESRKEIRKMARISMIAAVISMALAVCTIIIILMW